jgi:hypothetical protein
MAGVKGRHEWGVRWLQGWGAAKRNRNVNPSQSRVLSKHTLLLKLLEPCVHNASWFAWVYSRGCAQTFHASCNSLQIQTVELSKQVLLELCGGAYMMTCMKCLHAHSWSWLTWANLLMYTCLKSFFYAHNNSKSNEKNILNLELALFHLKCDVSAKQLTIIDFFVKKKKSDLDTGNFQVASILYCFCRPK